MKFKKNSAGSAKPLRKTRSRGKPLSALQRFFLIPWSISWRVPRFKSRKNGTGILSGIWINPAFRPSGGSRKIGIATVSPTIRTRTACFSRTSTSCSVSKKCTRFMSASWRKRSKQAYLDSISAFMYVFLVLVIVIVIVIVVVIVVVVVIERRYII